MKELQVYSVALNLYSEILRRLDKPSENKAAEDTFFHWIPAENPYCTQLIDIESGRRVTVRKSSDGMSLSGCHGDIETNFGRSMGAEAAKMMYDNKLHDEVRQPAK
jgi:hypothetical protein